MILLKCPAIKTFIIQECLFTVCFTTIS